MNDNRIVTYINNIMLLLHCAIVVFVLLKKYSLWFNFRQMIEMMYLHMIWTLYLRHFFSCLNVYIFHKNVAVFFVCY